MKRIVQLGGMLIALGMLFASCQMGTSDASFSGNSAEQESSNINGITIGIGSIDNSRTILPADWTDTRAEALTYVLLKKKEGETSYTTEAKKFSYSELKNNTATVNIELTKWDLKLIGYISADGSSDETPLADTGKPCLEAEKKNVDFSTGVKAVTFDLKPIDYTKTTSSATGGIDVTISWLTTRPKRLELAIYTEDTTTSAIIADTGRGSAALKPTESVPSSKFTGTDETLVRTYTWKKDDCLIAKMYKFAAVFYDSEDGGKVIGYYIDYLYVDGGNVSQATINYGDKFNTIPENPTWLAVKTVFVPQELPGTLATVKDWYLAEFHWNDNSTNETGFELVINDGGSDQEVNPSNLTTLSDLYPVAADFTDSGLSSTTNTLDAGRTSVVLKLKTGKLYTAKIRAINDFTPDFEDTDDDDFCDNLTRNGDGQGRSYAPIVESTDEPAKKQFGLFTVNYALDGSTVTYKTTSDSTTTTALGATNYIVGYNYHSEEQDSMTDNTLVYPYISKTGYKFNHWQTTTGNPKTEKKVIGANNSINFELEPVWSGADVRVSVTFPSYADAADVKIAKEKNIDNTVTFAYTPTNNNVIVTAGASLKTPSFMLTDADGKEIQNSSTNVITTNDHVWTWAPTTAPKPGYYCLQITGTYTDAGTGRDLTLCGNVYINVTN